jgi:hypothetical protein
LNYPKNREEDPMNFLTRFVLLTTVVAVLLTACGTKVNVPPTATATPDPCAAENIINEVKKVNDLQRQFDDASQLASVTPFAQLTGVIPAMQDVRRQAQDQNVPACLVTLKSYQIQQMNAVINTFLAFLAGGSQKPNTQLLSQGIAQARELHGLYNQELARLIGATYVPPTTITPGGPTDTPGPTSADKTLLPSNTPAAILVSSSGSGPVNIRSKPSLDASTLAWMDAGKSMSAVGETSDGNWIEVSDPYGNIGWVLFADVTVSGGGNSILPVITPAP